MGKPTPEERRRLREESAAARQKMQEIIDRVEARRQERIERHERSLWRRLFAR